jgi:hypothetical protein
MAASHGFELFPFNESGLPAKEDVPHPLSDRLSEQARLDQADRLKDVMHQEGGASRRIIFDIAC